MIYPGCLYQLDPECCVLTDLGHVSYTSSKVVASKSVITTLMCKYSLGL